MAPLLRWPGRAAGVLHKRRVGLNFSVQDVFFFVFLLLSPLFSPLHGCLEEIPTKRFGSDNFVRHIEHVADAPPSEAPPAGQGRFFTSLIRSILSDHQIARDDEGCAAIQSRCGLGQAREQDGDGTVDDVDPLLSSQVRLPITPSERWSRIHPTSGSHCTVLLGQAAKNVQI